MRKFFLVVVLLAAAVAIGYWWLQDQFYAPGPSTSIVRIQVEQGESVRTVLAQLSKAGLVKQPRAVELYLRITRHNKAPRIQVGMYEIPAGSSPAQILELFDQGRVVLEQLTVVEGSRFADLRHLRSIGAQGRGVVRPAFSATDMEARRWLKSRFEAAGLDATIDGLGNRKNDSFCA